MDINDRYRQGTLRVEHNWITDSWWHRIYGTVGLGINSVDSYFAYWWLNKERNQGNLIGMEILLEFCDKLCYQMIFNDLDDRNNGLRDRAVKMDLEDEDAMVSFLFLIPLY